MKQAVRHQPIETVQNPPKKITLLIRNIIFGAVIILALLMMLSLLTHHSDDPAWSKTVGNSILNNWMGAKGAYFSDILFTTIGRAAWLVPIFFIGYGYQFVIKKAYKGLSIETVIIRLVGLVLFLLSAASLLNITTTSQELTHSGGAIGEFITALLTHSVDWLQAIFPESFISLTISKIILLFFLFVTAIMATGAGPITWIETVGKILLYCFKFTLSIFESNKTVQKPEKKNEFNEIEHLMEKKSKKKSEDDESQNTISTLFKRKVKSEPRVNQEPELIINTPEKITQQQRIEPNLHIDNIPKENTVKAKPSSTITPLYEPKTDEFGNPKIPSIFKRPTIKSEPQNHLNNDSAESLTHWLNEPEEPKHSISSTQKNPNIQNKSSSIFSHIGSFFSSKNTKEKPIEPVIIDDNEYENFVETLEKYHSPHKHYNAPESAINSVDETITIVPDSQSVDMDLPIPQFIDSFIANDDPVISPFWESEPISKPIVEEKFQSSNEIKPIEPELVHFTNNEESFENVEPSFNSFLDSIPKEPTFSMNSPTLEEIDNNLVTQPVIEPQRSLLRPKPEPIAEFNGREVELLKYFPNAGQLPPIDLLKNPPETTNQYDVDELNELAQLIEEQLRHFNIKVTVENIEPGPVVTRFELDLAPGVKVAQINNLEKDIARGLSVTSVRVVDIIPGTSYVGLEIPNKKREIVYFKSGLKSEEYYKENHPLTLILGKSISGTTVIANLAKMPHLLVAGTTGSGKSVGVNTMLLSMLFKASPEELRLILIDPKMLELSVYNDIPHLLTPVVTDMKESANALRWCVAEMERRYMLMSQLKVRNIAGFNQKVKEAFEAGNPIIDPLWRRSEHVSDTQKPPLLTPLPFIVVVIDEFADMMMLVGKKCEELIARLAQKARASGIHLILATQRPSVDVITGLIKANIPTRIAFQVSSKIDSRTIIDQQGAEALLGHGDMLYVPPGVSLPIRVHGAFVDDHEVNDVVEFLKTTGEPDYIEDILQEPTEAIPGLSPEASGVAASPSDEQDPLFDEAVKLVVESQRASISYIQRKLRVGYQRAARLMEEMEDRRIVTPPQPNGNREVILAADNTDF